MEGMTDIDAKEIVRPAFPPEEGVKLAQSLLAHPDADWEGMSVDLTALPAGLLISAFFNSFLQTVYEQKPHLLPAARAIEWKVKFDFQKANVTAWMSQFQPYKA
jgi:hypothetical protein